MLHQSIFFPIKIAVKIFPYIGKKQISNNFEAVTKNESKCVSNIILDIAFVSYLFIISY